MNWYVTEYELNPNYLVLHAPSYVKKEFEHKYDDIEWNVYLRRYTKVQKVGYLYRNEGPDGFLFPKGFSGYLLENYYDQFDPKSLALLNEYDPIRIDTEDLYDYQVSDLNELLKFKRGLFQVYTSYGKTQIIAYLCKYFLDQKKRVLLITPSNTALVTNKDRLKKVYGIETPYFTYEDDFNVINIKGYLYSNEYKQNKKNPYWAGIDVIIADEVEGVVTDTSIEMFNLCTGAERIYGFSATADKTSAREISFNQGLSTEVVNNKSIISYFGRSVVYKKPDNFDITIYDIKSTIFLDVKPKLSASDEFNEVIYNLFVDPRVCDGISKIVDAEKGIFIPMFRLQVIDHWLKTIFNKPGFIVINICGRGYELWESGEKIFGSLTMDDINALVDNDIPNVIVGTRSATAAADIPNLKKCMLLHSRLAGVVIQAIGRVTRKKKFAIYNLIPTVRIPMYTSHQNSRRKLIDTYYSECKVTHVNKLETDYGIY